MDAFTVGEAAIRLFVFVAVFAAMAIFELWSPRLERDEMRGALKSRRWLANVSLVVISSVVLRLVFPAAAVGAALYAETRDWGLLRVIDIQPILAGVIGFVALDLAIWAQHVAMHRFSFLWRLHRVHHADTGFDVTTGLRFHPVEILLSMLWKAALVIALGVPVLAVLIFEIVLNATSMFSHANIRLPKPVERIFRALIVTPDMHRVHHSAVRRETDSNYGFNLSLWDRLFGTYHPEPAAGHEAMTIGLGEWRGREPSRLLWLLLLPFRKN